MDKFLFLQCILQTILISGLEISGQGDNGGDHVDFSEAISDPDTGLMCVFSKGRDLSK